MAARHGGELNMRRPAGAHRASALYKPSRTFFWGGMLLIFAFGMALAGIAEAYSNHDEGWAYFFTGAAVTAAGMYFWIVLGWLAWIGRPYDLMDVNTDVNSRHEWDHHPGES